MESQEVNSTATILNRILQSYDTRDSPDVFTGEPVVMEMSIYVLELYAISSDDMVRALIACAKAYIGMGVGWGRLGGFVPHAGQRSTIWNQIP